MDIDALNKLINDTEKIIAKLDIDYDKFVDELLANRGDELSYLRCEITKYRHKAAVCALNYLIDTRDILADLTEVERHADCNDNAAVGR